MKYELAKEWKEYKSSHSVYLNDSNYWCVKYEGLSGYIIAHKDAIDPTLIRQVPEVGDYLVFSDNYSRPTNTTTSNLYEIIGITSNSGGVITFYFKNDINNTDNIDGGCYYFLRRFCHFATPEEVADWEAKQKPVYEVGGGMKRTANTNSESTFTKGKIYPIIYYNKNDLRFVCNSGHEYTLRTDSSAMDDWEYIPPSEMPKEKTPEQKVIDDIWEIVNKFKINNA